MKSKRFSRFTLVAAGLLLAVAAVSAPAAKALGRKPSTCCTCTFTADYGSINCTCYSC